MISKLNAIVLGALFVGACSQKSEPASPTNLAPASGEEPGMQRYYSEPPASPDVAPSEISPQGPAPSDTGEEHMMPDEPMKSDVPNPMGGGSGGSGGSDGSGGRKYR